MPINDMWDWPLLLYVGTVILKRSEAQFWRMTPRKLNALIKVHIDLHSSKKSKQQSKLGFIDQVF